jgi:hypothetical protein
MSWMTLKASFTVTLLCLSACERQHKALSQSNQGQKVANSSAGQPKMQIGSGSGPKMIRYVRPIYPVWARKQHVEGIVDLAGTIGKDGRIRNLVVLSGPPFWFPMLRRQSASGHMKNLRSMVRPLRFALTF